MIVPPPHTHKKHSWVITMGEPAPQDSIMTPHWFITFKLEFPGNNSVCVHVYRSPSQNTLFFS